MPVIGASAEPAEVGRGQLGCSIAGSAVEWLRVTVVQFFGGGDADLVGRDEGQVGVDGDCPSFVGGAVVVDVGGRPEYRREGAGGLDDDGVPRHEVVGTGPLVPPRDDVVVGQ